MEPRLQRRIQRYGWDKAAAAYEDSWQRQLEPAQAAMLAHAALRPGERVLDVACGTGLLTFAAAASVGVSGSVVGVDLSQGMIDLAQARAEARGLHRVQFERMGAEDLELPDASVDVGLCGLGLMYVPDPPVAVGELARVVRPGGRVVASVWGQRNRCGWAEIFPIVDAQVQSEVCPMFFALGTGDRLRSTFEDAGLVDIAVERIEARLAWSSEEEACGAAFAGGPVALAYSRFDQPTREVVRTAYLASIAPWRTEHGYAVPGEFVIVAGRKPN